MIDMKTSGQVAGNIDPQGHIVPLAGRGVALCQLVQDLTLGDDPEKVGFADFADGIDIIKIASTKGFQDPHIIALKQHGGGCRQRRLTHLKAPRDATPGSDRAPSESSCAAPRPPRGPDESANTLHSSYATLLTGPGE